MDKKTKDMLSISKDNNKFKHKTPKGQINAILKNLVKLNIYKNPHNSQTIRISYVKLQIIKMLKRYKRIIKVYWAINTKNTNYKKSMGVEEYSACDIQKIVIKLLENDAAKKVCKRTLELDIKLLNNLNLIKSKIIRFGKGKGSVAYYVQNMELMPTHKDAILEHLIQIMQDNLKDKIIIKNFALDEPFDNEPKNINSKTTKFITEKIEEKNNEQLHKNRMGIISHVQAPDVINKANISNINKKNSKNSLEKNSAKSLSSEKQKSEKVQFKRIGVKTRLIDVHKISRNYMQQVKELSNNDSTYVNALLNLETAINEYGKEYDIEDILKHFLKQFGNRYKYKVWMMMKRKDGVINDYDLIWEGRFKDWYSHKHKKNYTTTKERYGEKIRLASKNFEFNASKNVKDEEEEKKEKEKTEKECKLKLKRQQEYIERLFRREEEERRARIRRREEEKAKLRMEVKEEIRSYVENSDSSDDIAKLYPLYKKNRMDNITIRPPRPQINTNF
ncbi:plasmid maintenance protein [Borrelia duttonii]|uniref:plasmid maintenance protein n=1 Tax=Borrelia duttonii TaxID=40834 RepID=UPI0004AE7FBB|nr:plasmid maintenance protein [Borrelia duttonii]